MEELHNEQPELKAAGESQEEPEILEEIEVEELAIDGIVSHGVTHTKEPGTDVWWEVDLQKMTDVDRIVVWNRKVLNFRLANFRVSLLDAERRLVWKQEIAKPPIPNIELKPTPGGEIEILVPVTFKDGKAELRVDYLYNDKNLSGGK